MDICGRNSKGNFLAKLWDSVKLEFNTFGRFTEELQYECMYREVSKLFVKKGSRDKINTRLGGKQFSHIWL